MGKITVKHYLNTRLKPEIDLVEGRTYSYYPLYVSVTVNKITIRRRSKIFADLTEEEFINKSGDYTHFSKQIEYEADLLSEVTSILMHDIEHHTINKNILYSSFHRQNSKDQFINTLNAYLDYYTGSIFMCVFYYCYKTIANEVYNRIAQLFRLDNHTTIRRIISFEYPNFITPFVKDNLSFESVKLDYLANSLQDILSTYALKTGYDIPYIDWINNKIQPIYTECLKERAAKLQERYQIELTDAIIAEFISVIDNIVKNHYLEYTEAERRRGMEMKY